MGGSLIVLGAATWMFTVVHGYWQLVLFIVIAGQAASVFTLTNVAVVPEVFGRSRWIKALSSPRCSARWPAWASRARSSPRGSRATRPPGTSPSRWPPSIMVGGGARRHPPGPRGAGRHLRRRVGPRPTGPARPRRAAGHPRRPERQGARAGSLLFWSGVGSTAYVAILFFQRVLHAGASAQTVAGLATGLPVFFIGIALGDPLSRWLTTQQLAIGAPLVGAVLAGVQYFDTHIWQAVVLSYIGAPFVGAYVIALAPMLLQLLPRAGGLGERLGRPLLTVQPVQRGPGLCGRGGHRRHRQLPADLALPGRHRPGPRHRQLLAQVPGPHRPSPDMVTRLWEWSIVQAESMSETGIVTGLLAAPLLGVVTKEDADSAVVVDMARNILGNPYEDDRTLMRDDDAARGRRGQSGTTARRQRWRRAEAGRGRAPRQSGDGGDDRRVPPAPPATGPGRPDRRCARGRRCRHPTLSGTADGRHRHGRHRDRAPVPGPT